MQQHRRADADGEAGHGGNDRLLERRENVQHAVHVAVELVQVALGDGREIAEVVAGGECVAGAGDRHATDTIVAARGLQRVGELAVHRVREGVLLLGPVDGQGQDLAGACLVDPRHEGLLGFERPGRPI